MPQPLAPDLPTDSAPDRMHHPCEMDQSSDLKFVPTKVDDQPVGGWYRELPDGHIEVMSRAQLECVPLHDGDPEEQARVVVERLIRQKIT
jgi:hypothetical protein